MNVEAYGENLSSHQSNFSRRRFLAAAMLASAGVAIPWKLLGKDGKPVAKRPIKIGQIGVTHEHAAGIYDAMALFPDVFEIVGVVDDRKSKEARFGGFPKRLLDKVKWLTEEELFNTPGLEAVAVETANFDLIPTALRCVKRNLHVHMDKPGGENLAQYKELLDICRDRKLAYQIGYMFRTNPAIQYCQRAIQDGLLGKVYQIEADMNHNYGGPVYQKYVSRFKGGISYNLLCHHIDWIVRVLGRPTTVKSLIRSTSDALPNSNNNALTVMEYPGTIITLRAVDRAYCADRTIKIFGSKGSILLAPVERFDGKKLQLELWLRKDPNGNAEAHHTIEFTIKNGRYGDMMLNFAKLVRGEMKPLYSLEHDYLTAEILMAASQVSEWK